MALAHTCQIVAGPRRSFVQGSLGRNESAEDLVVFPHPRLVEDLTGLLALCRDAFRRTFCNPYGRCVFVACSSLVVGRFVERDGTLRADEMEDHELEVEESVQRKSVKELAGRRTREMSRRLDRDNSGCCPIVVRRQYAKMSD